MASLLQAVRNAGANNVVILGGLAYSSDFSQLVGLVNNIPTLASRLNGLSIANVAACPGHKLRRPLRSPQSGPPRNRGAKKVRPTARGQRWVT